MAFGATLSRAPCTMRVLPGRAASRQRHNRVASVRTVAHQSAQRVLFEKVMTIFERHPLYGAIVQNSDECRKIRVKVSTCDALDTLFRRFEPLATTIAASIGAFSDYAYTDANDALWDEDWRGCGMPPYSNQRDPVYAYLEFQIYAGTEESWSKVLGQRVPPSRKHMSASGFATGRDRVIFWFPASASPCARPCVRLRAFDHVPPRYPIYVVSKGRHKTRRTSRLLETLGVGLPDGCRATRARQSTVASSIRPSA